jgi:formylglycine-generating enzyme required for sulfatase activity
MNKRRTLPIVILFLVILCTGSGVLAYRLLDQLGNGTSPLASLGAFLSSIGPGGSDDTPQNPSINPAANSGPVGAGVASDRKWMHKSPPYQAQGTPLALQGDDDRLNRPGGASFGGFPLFFEDCNDYGGELDMLSAGADIDFFLMPGLTCIDLRRPEVNVPENEERTYEIEDSDGSRVFNACELNQELQMCLNLGQLNPNATVNANQGNAAENENQAADPRERLANWHSHFTRDTPQDAVRLDSAPKRDENPAVTSGDGRNNYLTGSDPSRWFRDLPGFARAHYRDIMPGVDLACYADQTRIEYLLTFWPGTQPSDFTFSYNEALSVAPLGSGNVAVDYDCARVLHHRPMAYHVRDGRPEPLNASYSVNGNTINVHVDKPIKRDERADRLRDGTRVPKPQLDFLTHFGGNGSDVCYALAHDAKGFAHMTGMTTSSAFSADRREQSPYTENTDVFVVRFASANHQLHTSTFIGGSHDDRAFGIVTDEQGNSYICGETLSPDFPAVGAPADVSGRGWDAFVAKLDAITGEIVFGYRIGGAGDDRAYGIALDPDGNVILTGMTYSDDFPTGPGDRPKRSATNGDAFLIKLSKDGDRIMGGSRFGGSDSDHAFGLTTDALGFSYVVGETRSDDFPLTRALQSEQRGSGWDGFIVKFDKDCTTPVYATRVGGRNDDHAYCVAVDLAGYAYVGGETSSEDFPTMSGLQTNFAGGEWDGFVMKIEPEGKHAVYASYIGGSSNDRIYAIAADVDGHLFFGGATQSSNMPMLRAVQPDYKGEQDGFIGRLSPKGNTIDYLTFIGGEKRDSIHALSLHTSESVVFAGRTSSTNLIVLQPMQSSHRGREDTLVGRLMSEAKPSPEMRLVKAKGQPGGPEYDFYIGAHETSNDEYVRFLNDAQANPSTDRGTNLYFDARGDVWFNTNHVQKMHEILSIQDSRIVYQPHFPVGSRYGVTPVLPRDGDSYARHPVVGVSWFGAIKYCNWLTLATGRGPQERCFREGPNPLDWAPVTCSETNWARGRFTPGEREAWTKYRGFRLPMDNCAQPPMDNDHVFLVTRQEFVAFLNDAQRDPRSLKGMNLRFNAQGDVAYSVDQKIDDSELFLIAQSGISYTPSAPVGKRYAVEPTVRDANHIGDPALAPVKNVSWIGAIKYCNWMSLNAGLADTDLSYREGTNGFDWAATTVPHEDWVDKDFSDQTMRDWLDTKGHKLPYQSERVDTNQIENLTKYTSATNSYPNPYNEFHKASAWNRTTNGTYAFGRDKATLGDANFLGSGLFRIFDTSQTGYFDGTDHDGRHPTSTNQNAYGISDLSGNVEEWLIDPGTAGSLETRACYGGSWLFPLPTVDQRFFVHPYFTDNFRGFRVTSTVADEEMHAIRLPLRICICGYGVGPGSGPGRGTGEDGDDIPGQRKGTRLGFDESEENDHLIPNRDGEEEEEEEEEVVVEEEEEEVVEEEEEGPVESPSGDGDVSGEEDSGGEEDVE